MPPLLLVIAIASIPGVVAWWTGRKLVRLGEDPVLPELMLARQQRLLLITWLVIVASFFAGQYGFWIFLLAPVSVLVGGTQVRRALLGDRSNLALFLWRAGKSLIGTAGFWILLAMTPALIAAVPEMYRIYAVALLPLLLAWEQWYMRVWLRLHDAKPLHNETLAPRVASIVQRAGIAAPDLYMIGAPGTRFVNAVALPDVGRPAIALGNAIMELLEPDEVAAVYAHELAHVEEHSPRKLRRLQAVNRLLIVLAVALPLLAWRFVPSLALWVNWLVPIAVFAVLLRRGRDRQKHETESDLRAAALVGDPEAVVRGLVKIHVHGMIPRRWAVDFERSASHPSLTRRIQALRGHGAEAVASLGAPKVLATARQSRVVVFDDVRAYWFDGVPDGTAKDLESLRTHASGMRSVTWRDLVELRVAVDGDDRALKATHKNGDTWTVPLEPTQVADVQKALDVVDVKLRRELGTKPIMNMRLVAGLTLLAMLLSGSIGIVTLPALVALIWPSTALLAAIGAVAVSHVPMKVLLSGWLLGGPVTIIGMAATLVFGVGAMTQAWGHAQRGKRDGLRLTLLVLGVLAALMIGGVAIAAPRMSLRELGDISFLPALAATLFGLAAAVIVTRARAWRWSGAAFSAAALGVGVLTVVNAKDSSPSEFARASAQATEIRRVNLGTTMPSNLRLSPSGAHFVLEQQGRYGYSRTGSKRQLISLGSGAQREFDALQAEFIDDERVLVLRHAGDSMDLRLERADSGFVEWKAKLPWLDDATLIVSRDGSWTVAGAAPEQDSLIVLSGATGPPIRPVRKLAFDSLQSHQRVVMPGGSRVLTPVFAVLHTNPLMSYLGVPMTRASLWDLTAEGRHHVTDIEGFPQCGAAGDSHAVCLTRGGRTQHVWLLQSDGTAQRVGSLRNYEAMVTVGPGAHVMFAGRDGHVEDVDAAAKTITRIGLADEGFITESRVTAGRLAVVRQDTNATFTTFVVLYRVQ
jgi:Zn-dependent protease with chaperone function